MPCGCGACGASGPGGCGMGSMPGGCPTMPTGCPMGGCPMGGCASVDAESLQFLLKELNVIMCLICTDMQLIFMGNSYIYRFYRSIRSILIIYKCVLMLNGSVLLYKWFSRLGLPGSCFDVCCWHDRGLGSFTKKRGCFNKSLAVLHHPNFNIDTHNDGFFTNVSLSQLCVVSMSNLGGLLF